MFPGPSFANRDNGKKPWGGSGGRWGRRATGGAHPTTFFVRYWKGGPIAARGSFGLAGNPWVYTPGLRGAAGGSRSPNFLVQADLFLTPTAAFADIVLPIASAWEREGLCVGFRIDQNAHELVLRPAVVPPRGEARADIEVVFDLATRLGFGEHFWN